MKIKSVFYMSLVMLIALFAIVQTAIAQLPCGPTPSPSASLFVNWPQFQFDAAHSGCNPYEHILNRSNVVSLSEKWLIGMGFECTAPVVANGVLYIFQSTDWGNFVSALNAGTGALLWQYEFGLGVYSGQSVVVNGIVYAGASDGNIYALNARTGTLVWKYATGNQYPSLLAVAYGVLYASSFQYGFFALNANSGALIWQYPIAASATPAIANGAVYIGSSDHKVYALNANTGAFVWSYPTGGNVVPSPSVANGVVYVSADKVYALNASTGAPVWQFAPGYIINGAPAVANGVAYVGSGLNIYALNATSGALVWKSDDFYLWGNWQYPDSPASPAIANGVAYVASEYAITALDLTTGAVLWSQNAGRLSAYFTSPMVVNGTVYVGFGVGPVGSAYLWAFHLSDY
jgi:eukaryotic-like serine/threonine-protein kinase